MPILQIILVFVVVGVLLWAINQFIPMQDSIKKLMNIAVVVLMVIWMLYLLFPSVLSLRVGPH